MLRISLYKTYQELCLPMLEKRDGQHGMLQHIFVKEEDANKLLAWLQQQTILQGLDIRRASVRQEFQKDKKVYVVRLTKQQYQAIVGEEVVQDSKQQVILSEVDRIFLVHNSNQPTPLHQLALWSESRCLAMLEAISDRVFNIALVNTDEGQSTPLHWVAHKSPAAVFNAFLTKAHPDTLNIAITIQSISQRDVLIKMFFGEWEFVGCTVLHVAASKQPEASFLALIAKASSEAISKVLVQENIAKYTVLYLVAYYYSSNAFIALLEKSSPEAVNAAFSKKTFNLLIKLFPYHTPEAIAKLFSMVEFDCIKSQANKMPESIVKKVASYLLHEPSWHETSLVQKLFIQMGLQLTPYFLAHYFDGDELPKTVQDGMMQIIRSKHPDTLTQKEKSWLESMLSPHSDSIERKTFNTKTGRSIQLGGSIAEEDVRHIWLDGLLSWQDYRFLRLHYAKTPGILTVLNRLQQRNLSGEKCLMVDNMAFAQDEQEKKDTLQVIMSCIESNNGLLKIIKPENWDEFFRQIKDYNDRPALRAKKVDKKKATHKFVHLSGEIVAYQPRQANLPNLKSYTKKTSTTLFARNLSTAVFGEHDQQRLLVGLIIDRSKCRVRALLARDSGTYNREWLGSLEDVKEYKKYIDSVNYTDEEKFVEQVNTNPHQLNEVLAEISRESLLAIVMTSNTEEARKIAQERYEAIRKEFGISLPIVYYDRVERKLKESGRSFFEETIVEEKLLALEHELRSKQSWQPSAHSQLNPLRLFTPQASYLPGTAVKILEKIEAAKQSACKGKPIWKETLQEVKSLLEVANANTALFRSSDDSKQFYQATYTNLK